MTKSDLQSDLDAGLSYREIARRRGVSKDTAHARAKAWGIIPERFAGNPDAHQVWFRGEHRSIQSIAREVGVPYTTVWGRYKRGVTGDALVAPSRPKAAVPACYELGYSLAEWRSVADMAREYGTKAAANRTGLPYGAIAAAEREEWERLS